MTVSRSLRAWWSEFERGLSPRNLFLGEAEGGGFEPGPSRPPSDEVAHLHHGELERAQVNCLYQVTPPPSRDAAPNFAPD
jgi:hypothetical protein